MLVILYFTRTVVVLFHNIRKIAYVMKICNWSIPSHRQGFIPTLHQ